MPLRFTHQNVSFDADATRLMGYAFDHAIVHLTVRPPKIVQECMANRIIEAANAGERDVIRLSAAALNGMVGALNDAERTFIRNHRKPEDCPMA
jgi:hypothetical protein